jgi:hypothetical protein
MDKYRQYKDGWARNHPERIDGYNAKYRKDHPKQVAASRTRFKKEHPERSIASRYKYSHKEPIENKISRLGAQGYKCANQVCLKPVDVTSGHQDHDHKTGEKRGVLCGPCNHALGLLKDNANVVRGLATYRELFS